VGNPSPTGKNSLPAAKFVYFIYFAGFAIYLPFIYIYLRSIGLSGLQIGILTTISPLIGMLSGPLWGILNDRFGRTRLLLGVAVIGSILAAWGIATASSFAILAVMTALFSLFFSTITPMLDSNTLLLLGERRAHYGSIRLWGSAGYVLLTLVGGFLLERLGLDFLFPLFTLCMLILLISLIWYPARQVELGNTPLIFKDLWKMLRQSRWLVFVMSAMLVWVSATGLNTFLGVYLMELKASEGLIGLTMAISGAAEIPSMYFGARLLKRFSPRKLIAAGMGAYTLRMFCYGIMPSPEWAPLISLLNGASFGLFWIGSVTYVNELAPDEIKATSQGLLLAIMNLASLVSSTFIGWLYDTTGPANLFIIMSAFSLAAGLIFTFGTIAQREKPAV
jgi:MFS transporter, PPP family, 3-phenylpropionic acid transporter